MPFYDNYIAVQPSASDLFFRSDARLMYFMLFQSRHQAQYHTTSYPKFQMIQQFLEVIRSFNLQFIDFLTRNFFWKHSKYLNIIYCLRRALALRQHSLFYTRNLYPKSNWLFQAAAQTAKHNLNNRLW